MSEEAERTKNVRAEIRRQLEHGNVSVQWSGWVDATGLRSMIYVWGKKHNRKLSTHIVQDGELYTLTTTDRATATLPTVYSDITLVRALERGTLLQAAGETDYEALAWRVVDGNQWVVTGQDRVFTSHRLLTFASHWKLVGKVMPNQD
jgi:hypothetical protein